MSEFKKITDLRGNECKFPVEERNGTHYFCAKKRAVTEVYCEEHAKLLYQPPKPRREPLPSLQNG